MAMRPTYGATLDPTEARAEAAGYRRLGAAILAQALAEARPRRWQPRFLRALAREFELSPEELAELDPEEREEFERTKRQRRDEARTWLLGGGPGFRAVCRLVGRDPERLLAVMRANL